MASLLYLIIVTMTSLAIDDVVSCHGYHIMTSSAVDDIVSSHSDKPPIVALSCNGLL